MKAQKLTFFRRQLRIGMPFVIREFHFKNAGRQICDDGSYLAAQQALLGQIASEGNDIQQFHDVHILSQVDRTRLAFYFLLRSLNEQLIYR